VIAGLAFGVGVTVMASMVVVVLMSVSILVMTMIVPVMVMRVGGLATPSAPNHKSWLTRSHSPTVAIIA